MTECVDKLSQIKKYINKKIKLINIQCNGSKSDNRSVNIQPVLKALSKKKSIPISEKFNLFDFEAVRENIRNSSYSNERIRNDIKRTYDLECEYNKYRKVTLLLRDFSDKIKAEYICGKYHNYKVIYSDNIDKIRKLNEKIQQEKKKIDIIKFGEGITACCNSFTLPIKGVLERHEIKEESEELRKKLDECFKKVNDIGSYINKLEINYEPVLDISKEILTDINFINAIDKMESIQNSDRKLIREYYNISKLR